MCCIDSMNSLQCLSQNGEEPWNLNSSSFVLDVGTKLLLLAFEKLTSTCNKKQFLELLCKANIPLRTDGTLIFYFQLP